MMQRFETLLEERIRPHLRAHGGDAEILSYEDGVLHLRLLGQCSTCPAALMTNETLIEAELKQAVPELVRVSLEQEVSPDLIEEAKRLMTRSRTASPSP